MKRKLVGFLTLAALYTAIATGCGTMHGPGRTPPPPPGAPARP
ncbi:hypothetical protein [Mucilaginibacter sp.]